MFYKDKKVLVTGGTGFVGLHIVQELLKQGAQVRVPVHLRGLCIQDKRIETMTADLTNINDCRSVLRGIDYCFHAAGTVGAAAVKNSAQMSSVVTNLILTGQMLQAAWESGTERFLLFGSSTGYPAINIPVKEELMWDGPVHRSYFGYGWMRRYLEKLAEFTAMNSPVKIAILRPTAVYGPYDNFDPLTSHVMAALIRKAVNKDVPFVVWGTGREVRDFIYVSDLAAASLVMLEKCAQCDPVNIGSGEPVTVAEIAHLILEAAGMEGVKVVFDASKPVTIPFRAVDVSKASRVLDFKPKVSLKQGIVETISWYRKNKEN